MQPFAELFARTIANPMPYTLGQAARAVGKAKSTLSHDLKTGKISATRNSDGSVSIDPAELHRVYPAVSNANGQTNGKANDPEPLAERPEQSAIETLLREEVADLRARLDRAEARLDRLLLTDQRTKAEPPRSLWQRFLAWRR